MASKPEARLQELHITLPAAPKAMAKYKTAVQVGNMLYVSGHGPAAGGPMAGKLGADLSTEQGKEVARRVGLNILAPILQVRRPPIQHEKSGESGCQPPEDGEA